jgi:peptide deformylase
VFVSKRVVVYRMIASRIPAGSGIPPRPWTVMVNPVITPRTAEKTPVWERCLSIPGLHGKVPRFLNIQITYQDLNGQSHTEQPFSSWAALLQHECDHLDGVLFPMRMTDLSLLAFNEEPGPLARELHEGAKNIDPLFIDLVERWPGRSRWFPK